MLLETDIPIKYKATVMQKLNILESMDSSDQEYYKIKTGWIRLCVSRLRYKNLSVNMTTASISVEFIENSRNILDDCVYGMNDAKSRFFNCCWAVGFQSLRSG
jgi:hypothetical protein